LGRLLHRSERVSLVLLEQTAELDKSRHLAPLERCNFQAIGFTK